jgi:broad specificity phosphatase PhoE
MHIYFVRHGETALNLQNVHQSPGTSLSSLGKERAVTVAEYLRGVNPDLIISSEYTRAQETARIIGFRTGLPPIVNGLFNEVMRPSVLFGQSHYSIQTLQYILRSVLKRKNPSWRYADGENFIEMSNRAKRALAYLEPLSGAYDSVVVVSHAIFTNLMVSYLCDNKMPSLWKLFLIFLNIERMKNTDIIHAEYFPGTRKDACAWRRIGAHTEGKPVPVTQQEYAV